MNHSMHNHSDMNMSMPTTTMDHSSMGHGNMDMGGHDMGGHDMVGMDMHMNGSECMSMGMMMYFHTGKCEYILFEALRTNNTGSMVGACVAIFFLAIIYEGLKVLREYLLQRAMVAGMAGRQYSVSNGASTSSSRDAMVVSNKNVGVHMMSCGHFIQTVLHMVQVFISYCLMLVFMTYNVWLCIAVIFGAGAGYFLFGWRKAIVVDINEHCH